jgi:hypothetical protein
VCFWSCYLALRVGHNIHVFGSKILRKIYRRLNSISFLQCRCRPTAQTAAFRIPPYWHFYDSYFYLSLGQIFDEYANNRKAIKIRIHIFFSIFSIMKDWLLTDRNTETRERMFQNSVRSDSMGQLFWHWTVAHLCQGIIKALIRSLWRKGMKESLGALI